MKRIVVFGTYNESYPRNRTLFKRLEKLGFELVHIQYRGKGLLKYIRLIKNLMQYREAYDLIFVPFPGHNAVILASLITRKKVIFDAFISLYDTYVHDRQTVRAGSWKARYYKYIDKIGCSRAHMIIVDTPEHAEYFLSQYKISRDRMCIIPVSTDLDLFQPQAKQDAHDAFTIFWHGKYTAFHNVLYIVEAAQQLQDMKFRFILLGGGGEFKTIKKMVQEQKIRNVEFLPFVEYEELPRFIQNADVCLGVFGASNKVDRVVPNKIFEYLACGKPILTRQSTACTHMLQGADIQYVSGKSADDLARALQHARDQIKTGYISERNVRISKEIASGVLQSIERCFIKSR